jgi:hypothetical protein
MLQRFGARRTILRATWVLLLVPVTALPAQAPSGTGFQEIYRFPVSDTVALRKSSLEHGLLLTIHWERTARGAPLGWYVSVTDPGGERPERNLLFRRLAWHGPYPTDLFAWHHRLGYSPDERVLPVYGFPLELRVACERCQVTGDSSEARFVAGEVSVGWRRLSTANPPQQ